jgi:hypothetical protein
MSRLIELDWALSSDRSKAAVQELFEKREDRVVRCTGNLEMGRQRDQGMLMVLLENWIMGSGFWNTIAKAYTHG